MNASRICKLELVTTLLLLGGCGLLDQSATQKPSNSGLIATPVTYYSTSRARYLGAKYKDHLDRLVERIVRNPKTAKLQFANNIASVGGIGFYTHSATKTADERYLEVVLAAPETFETKGAHSDKVNQLFTLYGTELLTILSADNDIYQDKELTGYGLNLSWRNVIADPAGNRVSLERAIVYLSKDKTRNFLRREIGPNDLLADATIFAVEEDGPLNLISFRAPEVHQEYRPPIREDDIPPASAATKPVQAPITGKTDSPDQGKKEALQSKEPVAKVAPLKPPVAVAQNPKLLPPKTPVMPETPAKPAPPIPVIAAPVEVPVVEAAPVDFAKVEVPAPVTSPTAETKEVAPVVKPIVKSPEPTGAVMEAPKPVVALKIPPPVVDVAPPAVIAPAPRAEGVEPPAIQAKPIESVAPARVADAPKPPVVEVEPFLPLAPSPPIAASVSAPEAPKVAKPAPPIALPEAKAVEIVSTPPDAVMPTPSSQPVADSFSPPAQTVAKSMPPGIVARVPPAAAKPTVQTETKPVENVSAPPVTVKPAPPQMLLETPRSVPVQTAAKSAPPVIEAPARPLVPAPPPVVEKSPAKPAAEQLASLANKPNEDAPAKPAIARTAPKALEGFIIQLAFNDKERAQRWAETMEKKGFAVSVTEAGAEGALRVRVGNFVLRDEAERQLKVIKQEGLNGIILNLPQAFRPVARTSIP